MNFIISILRTIFRHRWWIIIGTVIIALFIIFFTRHMSGGYDVKATLYTGIASGYSLESDKRTDWTMVQNSMDNLISIIQAESTLKKVSLRLFARILMQGNEKEDKNGITADSYKVTYNHVKNSPHGKDILALIDKSSEDKTVENLLAYTQPNADNYIYGLFYYTHPYYSFNALKKITVQRRLSSDLLDISYTSSDPGIAFNTINILMTEFVIEYSRIRYGETEKVIAYFKEELERIGKQLHTEEEDLTQYNVDKRIINYLDETKEIAAINKEFELREQDVLFAYNSSKAMIEELEKHMDNNSKQVIKNMQFMDKLREASLLTGQISEIESTSSNLQGNNTLTANKSRLTTVRKELDGLSDAYIGHKYTKEGTSRNNIINQWLDQTLLFEKAKAELQIVQGSRQELNERYQLFAPVGTMLKRKERSIDFVERNFLTTLQSYNEALMRKKNLEMTSATLKVLNEPSYPIGSNPTGRKKIVLAVCLIGLIAIVALLILIEIIDKTLRDAQRAGKVTGFQVIGAIPNTSSRKYSKYNKLYMQFAIKELSNNLLRFFNKRASAEMYVVNLLRVSEQSSISEVGKELEDLWKSLGLKVRYLSYAADFDIESKSYVLAKNATELYTPKGEDVLIVEYPPLEKSSIPEELLTDANINLLLVSATRGWKSVDALLGERLKKQVEQTPLYLCLTHTERYAVEDFTGLLPPYTFFRKKIYQLSQLALTEKTETTKKWKKEVDEDDDE